MAIGEKFTMNGVELLVLDEIDGNPFVICLDTGIETKFSNNSNDYRDSVLRRQCEDWLKEKGFHTLPRTIDLTAMDGYKGYGQLDVSIAPLTFDEYRKYGDILIPHVDYWFWLATAWGSPERDNWASSFVCIVTSNGGAGNTYYSNTSGRLAPTFILDKDFLDMKEEKKQYISLADFSTVELMEEIRRRIE